MFARRAVFFLSVFTVAFWPRTAQPASNTVTIAISATLGPILQGSDPLKVNGHTGTLTIQAGEALLPVSHTSLSATYTLPPGAVTVVLGTPFTTSTPSTMVVTLAATADVLTVTFNGQDSTVNVFEGYLAVGSWNAQVLQHPLPFSPSPQSLTSATVAGGPGSQFVYVLGKATTTLGLVGSALSVDTPYITIQTASPQPLTPGFSGFNDANVIHGVEYNDPKFEAMVLPLKPGFIRFPGGSDSLAFDWETAHENGIWINELTPDLNSTQLAGLNRANLLGQAKGGVCFTQSTAGGCYSSFSELTAYSGANAVVCINGYTDFLSNSAGQMVLAAQSAGVNVIEWEIGNEPYAYPLFFNSPASYANTERGPWYNNIASEDPNATVGLFYQGPFSAWPSSFTTWDNGMHAYTPQYWNAVSTHVYPVSNNNVTTSQEEQQLNSVLGYATNAYVTSYLDPLIGSNTPIFVTELGANTLGTSAFQTYLYYGIYLAEYIARMSTVPNVKGVGVQALYLGNSYSQGIIRAVNDFETYLINQVAANPNYQTNTATNPNTQFRFYYSAAGVTLQVANLAINSSNAVWPTTVNGNVATVPTAPVQGYGGPPIPAVFAQGYQAIDGSHYLLITNKSNQSVPLAIIVDGTLLEQTVALTYISNSSDTAANTPTNQKELQVETATSSNPISVGPYSVTTVHW